MTNSIARRDREREVDPAAGGVALTPEEQALLSALIRSYKPARVLEIGVWRGGSSYLIAAALAANGDGHLYSVDPAPVSYPDDELRNWATLIVGASPDALGEAHARAGGDFDLVFVDGDHRYHAVCADLAALLPILADTAYLLCHDAYYHEVAAAVDATLAAHPGELTDCGVISRTAVWLTHLQSHYYGLRLLRFHRTQRLTIRTDAVTR